jgi:glycerol-1-phosphate dehydrogenase [NAD(P)+]
VATLATTWLQGNPAHRTVVRVLEETGFTAFMKENRLDRAAFLEAVQLAPTIKPGYHTILSQPGAVERLQAQVKNDPSWDAYFD